MNNLRWMLSAFLKNIYKGLPVIRELRRIETSLSVIAAADVIRLMDFDAAGHPRYGSKKRLIAFERSVNSQNGEDGIIEEIFRRVGTTNRFFVEIGVGNGLECNTAFLLSQGWKGCWIDGGDAYHGVLEAHPDLRERLKTLATHVTRENVAGLLGGLNVPAEFDLLSLDIDQNTYYAWEGLRTFKPRVVVIEYNSSVPERAEWRVAYDPARTWNETNVFGGSLKSYELLGKSLGYTLVGCDFNGVNAFFVRDDLVGDKFEGPFTAENHYEPPRLALANFRRGHPRAIMDRIQ